MIVLTTIIVIFIIVKIIIDSIFLCGLCRNEASHTRVLYFPLQLGLVRAAVILALPIYMYRLYVY